MQKMTLFQHMWQLGFILGSPCRLHWNSQHHPKCLDV